MRIKITYREMDVCPPIASEGEGVGRSEFIGEACGGAGRQSVLLVESPATVISSVVCPNPTPPSNNNNTFCPCSAVIRNVADPDVLAV
jgi:hypothetical protein